MVGAMAHRGPDDRGLFTDARIALGMTRLAIIDTTSGGLTGRGRTATARLALDRNVQLGAELTRK